MNRAIKHSGGGSKRAALVKRRDEIKDFIANSSKSSDKAAKAWKVSDQTKDTIKKFRKMNEGEFTKQGDFVDVWNPELGKYVKESKPVRPNVRPKLRKQIVKEMTKGAHEFDKPLTDMVYEAGAGKRWEKTGERLRAFREIFNPIDKKELSLYPSKPSFLRDMIRKGSSPLFEAVEKTRFGRNTPLPGRVKEFLNPTKETLGGHLKSEFHPFKGRGLWKRAPKEALKEGVDSFFPEGEYEYREPDSKKKKKGKK